MEIPITYIRRLFINKLYRKNYHTESLINYHIRGHNPRVMVKSQTDRMRIDGENYAYNEQTKQTSQCETKKVDLTAI